MSHPVFSLAASLERDPLERTGFPCSLCEGCCRCGLFSRVSEPVYRASLGTRKAYPMVRIWLRQLLLKRLRRDATGKHFGLAMPPLQAKDAKKVLEKQYGVVPKEVKRMNGYQQVNFKSTLQEVKEDGSLTMQNYIMKFADKTNFGYCDNIDLQHAMLQHLHIHGISTSFPVQTTKRGTVTEYHHGEKSYTVQMLSFVEGVSINEADCSERDVEKISQDVGHLLGIIHHCLAVLEYDIKAASSIFSPFHIQNALLFSDKVDYVEDDSIRKIIKECFFSFETRFLSQLPNLRKGFIHGDFSDSNIIVRRDEATWQIAGVIDFEECCYGYVVGDVAISLAYMMLKAAASGADPLKAARLTLKAYESHIPLTSMEKRTLYDAVSSRMAVSYVSASYEAYINPANRDFVFCQAKTVPLVMKRMEEYGRRRVENFWFNEDYRKMEAT